MSTYTLPEATQILAWAAADVTEVAIVATSPGSLPVTPTRATVTVPAADGLRVQSDGGTEDAPPIVWPAGTTISAVPDAARLVVRRLHDGQVLYDSGEPGSY